MIKPNKDQPKIRKHNKLITLKRKLTHNKNNRNNKRRKIERRIRNIILGTEIQTKINNNKITNIWDKTNTIDEAIHKEIIITTNKEQDIDKTELENIANQKFPHINRDKAKHIINSYTDQSPIEKLINKAEAKRALKETKKKMYTSPEGIKFNTITKTSNNTKMENLITTICQMSIATSTLPINSRTSLGKIIPKKNPGQYRIVHMSSPIAAITEQIILHKLEYELETKGQYSNRQYGFMALRSRHDLITRMITNILNKRMEDKKCIRTTVISLDIMGAFDNVNHNIIIEKLFKVLGNENIITRWLANFLLNKNITLEYKKHRTTKRDICQGVPQGSSLGPILWNFMINRIEQGIISEGNTELLAYADDLILIDHNNNDKITSATLKRLTNKLATLNLNISAEKSQVMYIEHTEGNVKRTCNIEIGGKKLPMVKNMPILGITIKHNHMKLDINAVISNTKFRQNIHKLKRYKEIGTITEQKEWQTLINAYIRSTTIINNYPILAIDKEARNTIDRIITRTYKYIFDWPKNSSDKVIRLITNQPSCELAVKELINGRLNTEHNQYYEILKKILDKNIDITYIAQTRTKWREINNTKQNNNKHATLRRYADPETDPNIKHTNNINNNTWIIGNIGNRAYILNTKDTEYKKIIEHKDYATSYFSTLAALEHLTQQQIQNTKSNEPTPTKQLTMKSDDPVAMALANMNNHDNRIITIRELIHENNWQIWTTNNKTLSSITEELRKQMKDNKTPITMLNKPSVWDYKHRNMNKKRSKMELMIEMRGNMTQICRELHNKPKGWQLLNPSWITGKSMLALTGLINDENGQLKNGKEIECNCQGKQTYQHIVAHRIIECKTYKIDNDEYLEIITQIRDNTNTIGKILEHKQTQQKLLHLIRDLALPRNTT